MPACQWRGIALLHAVKQLLVIVHRLHRDPLTRLIATICGGPRALLPYI